MKKLPSESEYSTPEGNLGALPELLCAHIAQTRTSVTVINKDHIHI